MKSSNFTGPIAGLALAFAITSCIGVRDASSETTSEGNNNQAPTPQPPLKLSRVLSELPARSQAVLKNAAAHRLQIALAIPVRSASGQLVMHQQTFGDLSTYFYPASTVKLCAAIAAIETIHEINTEQGTAFDLDTPLRIEPRFPDDRAVDTDPTNHVAGTITVGHAIRKIGLVSDNAAFNWLYEFVGQEALNANMRRAGFESVRILHRLSERRSLLENRQNRAVTLLDMNRTPVFRVPDRTSDFEENNADIPGLDLGEAFMRESQRVSGPFSFKTKNRISLQDLQGILAAVVRPDIRTARPGFDRWTIRERTRLIRALGDAPGESDNPRYNAEHYPQDYAKFAGTGAWRARSADDVHVFAKTGRAYGFTTENCYIEDQTSGAGFFLAATLYTNPNGVLNDDTYGYAKTADVFLADLGEALTQAILPGPTR